MQNGLTHVASALRRDLDGMLAAPVLTDGADPLSVVRAAVAVQTQAGALVAAAVDEARAAGCTWQQIGELLGISRQAAFQRFGKPVDPGTGEVLDTTPLPEAAALADAVIEELAHGRWDAVTARFDAAVAERLNADGLAAAWMHVVGTVGSYERHGAVRAVRAGSFTVTDTRLAFEAGDFTARITFRDDRTIAGLFLLPAGNEG